MNPTMIIEIEGKDQREPLGFKCTADGSNWVFSDNKKCRYCLPVFDSSEKLELLKREVHAF